MHFTLERIRHMQTQDSRTISGTERKMLIADWLEWHKRCNASPAVPVADLGPALGDKATAKKKITLSGKQAAREEKRRQYHAADALELCEQILAAIEELPEPAEDFGYSVAEKTESIQEMVESRNAVTENQYIALENMLSGVNAWLHR